MEDPITIYTEDDDDEPLNDVVLDDGEDLVLGDRDPDDDSDSDTNSTSSAAIRAVPLSSSSAVSIAVLPPSSIVSINGSDLRPPVNPSLAAAAATAVVVMTPPNAHAAPVSERKPIEDSRKLFQRLWTDEDEIEILQGFLEYNTQRGPNLSGYHHDTTAFYDQIKSRLQYDCNKNQLVEKLRRLKKKFRNVVSRMSAGKDVVFKTPHDQATFEISRKIWSNSTSQFDEDDQNPNLITGSGSATPIAPPFHGVGDMRTPRGFGIDINSSDKALALMNMTTPDRSRKRPKVMMNIEEKVSRNGSSGGYEAPASVTVTHPVHVSVEETVKSSLPPLFKEFIDKFSGERQSAGGSSSSKGIESLMSNTIPMNFPAPGSANCGDFMEERWRKQQILELEVYSKRLELVQDQIKLALEELRSR